MRAVLMRKLRYVLGTGPRCNTKVPLLPFWRVMLFSSECREQRQPLFSFRICSETVVIPCFSTLIMFLKNRQFQLPQVNDNENHTKYRTHLSTSQHHFSSTKTIHS